MNDKQPIRTAPLDRPIMLHGGGWISGETGEPVYQSAAAHWQNGYWAMCDAYALRGYEGATAWSEIPSETEGAT